MLIDAMEEAVAQEVLQGACICNGEVRQVRRRQALEKLQDALSEAEVRPEAHALYVACAPGWWTWELSWGC